MTEDPSAFILPAARELPGSVTIDVWPFALPLLLAGPILRRVDVNVAWVWLATSRPISARAEVRSGGGRLGGGERSSFALGRNLHLTLLPMRAAGEYPRGVILHYNLWLNFEGAEEPVEIVRLGLGAPLYYEEADLRPSFVIPLADADGDLLYGSCRKAHGVGQDMLAAGDLLMAARWKDPKRRPSALLLVGDQIYADDVAPRMLLLVQALSQALMGSLEQIPRFDETRARTGPSARAPLVEKMKEAFSTSAGANHLMRFGEFAAMHLLAWCPNLWPADWSWLTVGAPGVRDEDALTRATKDADAGRSLIAFQGGVARVRRLLANIPTYMMFDDHEITDDWFRKTNHRLYSYSLFPARRIVSNGLAAYWAFQGVGHEPSRWAQAPVKPRQHEPPRSDEEWSAWLLWEIVQTGVNGIASDRFDDLFWARYDKPEASHPIRFSFVAPTVPPTLFVDTRTQRVYGDLQDPAPQLVSAYELDRLCAQVEELARTGVCPSPRGGTLLVAVATPVLGIPGVEWGQRTAAKLGQADRVDEEAWLSNVEGYMSLLRTLCTDGRLNANRYVLISGDVHYGFTASALVSWAERGAPGRPVRIDQLNCSALKNQTVGLDRLILGLTEALGSSGLDLRSVARAHILDALGLDTRSAVSLYGWTGAGAATALSAVALTRLSAGLVVKVEWALKLAERDGLEALAKALKIASDAPALALALKLFKLPNPVPLNVIRAPSGGGGVLIVGGPQFVVRDWMDELLADMGYNLREQRTYVPMLDARRKEPRWMLVENSIGQIVFEGGKLHHHLWTAGGDELPEDARGLIRLSATLGR